MRIAFAHYSSADDISGVTSWLIQLALYLKGEGCSVAILLLDLCEQGVTSPLELAVRQGGIEVFNSHPTGNLRKDVDATLAFLNIWRPDVFLPQCNPHHYIAAAIGGRAGLPWVFTIQSDDPDYWAVIDSLPPSRYGGRVVSVSRHIKATLEERADEINTMVIPPGVAIPSATAQGTRESFEVIYCGRLWEHQKRASLVTETLIQACRRGEGRIHATVIGDGYSREACEQMVREADLGDRIQFSGRLSSDDLKNVLIHTQAILFMSDFEGLPVALLMAMAAGVVPVARTIPSGIPEVVHHGQTGLLVNDDPAQAAEAILHLAADPSLWGRCSTGARALVRDHYGEKACHQKWLDLLTDIASDSRPAYPISGWHGVRLGTLSPLLTTGYRKQTLRRWLRLRESLRTGLAQSKGAIKKILGL
jgi:colanic acid/amylovoran biosynthesis glycosyltransferase